MRPKKKDPKTGKETYDPAEIVKNLEEYKENAKPFPMIVTFCDKYKITRSMLYLLRKQHKEIADAMEFLACKKKSIIITETVAGRINPQFAQFLLKYQCGDNENESNDKEPDNRPIINITIPKELKE